MTEFESQLIEQLSNIHKSLGWIVFWLAFLYFFKDMGGKKS